MTRYDLLVFDWDGTIVDSIATIVGCTILALADCGVEGASRGAIRDTIGLGIREMIEVIVPGCDDRLFDRICAAYRRRWFGGLGSKHQPFVGAREVMTELTAAGYLLAVATAKSRRGLEADLRRTGFSCCFHASRTGDEAPAKPHPGMIDALVEELGVVVQRTLVIGDTTHDLEMAANAGADAVGVLTGSHAKRQLIAAPQRGVLAGIHELPTWLEGLA